MNSAEAAPGEIDFDDRDRDCRTGLGRRDVVKADAAIRLRSAGCERQQRQSSPVERVAEIDVPLRDRTSLIDFGVQERRLEPGALLDCDHSAGSVDHHVVDETGRCRSEAHANLPRRRLIAGRLLDVDFCAVRNEPVDAGSFLEDAHRRLRRAVRLGLLQGTYGLEAALRLL